MKSNLRLLWIQFHALLHQFIEIRLHWHVLHWILLHLLNLDRHLIARLVHHRWCHLGKFHFDHLFLVRLLNLLLDLLKLKNILHEFSVHMMWFGSWQLWKRIPVAVGSAVHLASFGLVDFALVGLVAVADSIQVEKMMFHLNEDNFKNQKIQSNYLLASDTLLLGYHFTQSFYKASLKMKKKDLSKIVSNKNKMNRNAFSLDYLGWIQDTPFYPPNRITSTLVCHTMKIDWNVRIQPEIASMHMVHFVLLI